ncbi:MAG: HIT family protein [Deltaproteobacteria bacterium]|nr:HIT family protein [Deltaproteobacteria bacterium]
MAEGHCVFCKIVRGELPSMKLYEDERTLCFMDINPATRGHSLVVPKAHRENIYEMSEAECADVMNVTKRVADAVRKTLEPDGLNLLQANGLQAFQTVFHFHMHIIPRYTNDPIKLPWIPREGNMEEIRKNSEIIRAFFE